MRLRSSVLALSIVLIVATASAEARTQGLVVTSSAFAAGGRIPQRYAAKACGGQNIAPPLAWRGLPPLTRSFALSVYDPDANGGAGFWHWVIYDIPAATTRLGASADGTAVPPRAVTAVNGAGTKSYLGPCPPRGRPHHYRFTIYALDRAYVQATSDRRALRLIQMLAPNVLATGSLVATYRR